MTTYEIIKDLCLKKGIAITVLEKHLGFGRGSIGKLKSGSSITLKRLQLIADYFGVDVNFFSQTSSQHININTSLETTELVQALSENIYLRKIFDEAKDATSEDLQTIYNLLMALKRKESGNIDDTGC